MAGPSDCIATGPNQAAVDLPGPDPPSRGPGRDARLVPAAAGLHPYRPSPRTDRRMRQADLHVGALPAWLNSSQRRQTCLTGSWLASHSGDRNPRYSYNSMLPAGLLTTQGACRNGPVRVAAAGELQSSSIQGGDSDGDRHRPHRREHIRRSSAVQDPQSIGQSPLCRDVPHLAAAPRRPARPGTQPPPRHDPPAPPSAGRCYAG